MHSTSTLAVCPISDQRRSETPGWIKNLRETGADILCCDNSGRDYWKELLRLGVNTIACYDLSREGGGRPERKIADSFNALREMFLRSKYTHMWLVEWDIYPTPGLLDRLLNYNYPIIAVPYFSKGTEIILQGQVFTRVGEHYNFNAPFPPHAMFSTEVPRFFGATMTSPDILWTTPGTGCVLMRRDAVELLEFRYDEERATMTPDTWLWMDILDKQVPAYLYNLEIVEHKHKSWMEF